MGIRQEINAALKGLRKEAQLWGYYAPAHNQQSEANFAKNIPNMAWGTLGVGAGLSKGVWDRTIGEGAQGRWKDYLKEGWNAGFNHGDMVAAGMVEGIAKSIPFAKLPRHTPLLKSTSPEALILKPSAPFVSL